MVTFAGIELAIHPGVFSPVYGEGSHLLATSLPSSLEGRVLDMGTGSGVLGLLAAVRGGQVTAIDISPAAVRSALSNAEELALTSSMQVVLGDLFDALDTDVRFSLILFNPPFLDGIPETWLERAVFDPAHTTLQRFLREVPTRLEPEGKALVAFSDAGDLSLLERECRYAGLRCRELQRLSGEFTFFVLELTILSGPDDQSCRGPTVVLK